MDVGIGIIVKVSLKKNVILVRNQNNVVRVNSPEIRWFEEVQDLSEENSYDCTVINITHIGVIYSTVIKPRTNCWIFPVVEEVQI